MQLRDHMKKILIYTFGIFGFVNIANAQIIDTTKVYKKRVLENTEIDLLMSMYSQDGVHSPVNGGIGTEQLSDRTTAIVISIPLNADDVLTVDAGISAYTSASSSNINPWMSRKLFKPIILKLAKKAHSGLAKAHLTLDKRLCSTQEPHP